MTSPKLCQGNGVLHKRTRPQLLVWPACELANLFGEGTNRYFATAAESAGLELEGVIARPLYRCAETHSTGEVCMHVVSMSPSLQLAAGRLACRCRECAAKARDSAGARLSQAALRCLYD